MFDRTANLADVEPYAAQMLGEPRFGQHERGFDAEYLGDRKASEIKSHYELKRWLFLGADVTRISLYFASSEVASDRKS